MNSAIERAAWVWTFPFFPLPSFLPFSPLMDGTEAGRVYDYKSWVGKSTFAVAVGSWVPCYWKLFSPHNLDCRSSPSLPISVSVALVSPSFPILPEHDTKIIPELSPIWSQGTITLLYSTLLLFFSSFSFIRIPKQCSAHTDFLLFSWTLCVLGKILYRKVTTLYEVCGLV